METKERLKGLDQLIQDFGGSSDPHRGTRGNCELLLENLQAARRYLLGGCTNEFRSSIERAGDSVFSITNKGDRTDVRAILLSLLVKPAVA